MSGRKTLQFRCFAWSWGILSMSDRSRLLNLCRLGSVCGVSEADATRGVAPVIAGGTLARCLSPLLERGGGLIGGLGGWGRCGRGRRRYVRLDDAFGLGSCWSSGLPGSRARPSNPGLRLMGLLDLAGARFSSNAASSGDSRPPPKTGPAGERGEGDDGERRPRLATEAARRRRRANRRRFYRGGQQSRGCDLRAEDASSLPRWLGRGDARDMPGTSK